MRLVDADALIKELNNSHFPGAPYVDAGISIAIGKVCDAPTIDPERKMGKWIDEGFYADGHGAHAFRCSECGGHIIEYDTDPFCRWCGADMIGKKE